MEFSHSYAGNDQAIGLYLRKAAFFEMVVVFYGTILNNECRFQQPYCFAGCWLSVSIVHAQLIGT